jgi:hypothetical protein
MRLSGATVLLAVLAALAAAPAPAAAAGRRGLLAVCSKPNTP